MLTGLKNFVPLVFVAMAALSVILPAVADPTADESLPRPFTIGEDLPEDAEHANHGAFEGGATGTTADMGVNAFIPEEQLPGSDYPTGGHPSPLYGAEPFTQMMLRFEEFGPAGMPGIYEPGPSFPMPATPQGYPDPVELEAFMAHPLYPEPTRLSNTADENPWKPLIEEFLGRPLDTPPAEGRPPGEGYAHQRWDEFPPQVHYKSVITGARFNEGYRDTMQMHGYACGEWGPGKLYHNTMGVPGYEGGCDGIGIKFHPNMPFQTSDALWTFDGTLPPKLLMVRYGESILMRQYNALPVDPSANRGFGCHTITTHEHNGHNPAESDGYLNAFFFPGQYYDYRWPVILAGHDTVNTDATDPRAGAPDGNGGITQIPGDYRETMSTHWFHDHMMDFTAQNVYKGNAAMMNYYSGIDRGNEGLDDGINLRFPSGTELDWGNRDYDVNLLVADKAWDSEGQLWFNIFNLDGFIGDVMTVNWLYEPFFEVRARKYRFRISNGGVSRYLKLALVHEVQGSGGEMPGPAGSGVSYNKVPFHMIGNDGNIMEHAIHFDGSLGTDRGCLPTQAIGERYDIIVDFSAFAPGDNLYMVNILEHPNGRKAGDPIPLEEILSGEYSPTVSGNEWVGGDPCVGKFLEFRVQAYDGVDLSMDPELYEPGGLKMIPLPRATQQEINEATHRTFSFGRSSGTDKLPWTVKTDGGSGLVADPRRVSAAANLGDLTSENMGVLEIWTIENGGGGWSHPIHIHFEEGIILSRDGETPPIWEQFARKDMYRVGNEVDSSSTVEIAIRFREFAGTYMEHCHNTQHEDHAMLVRWDIENPGQLLVMPTPIPTWDGVEYVDSLALPTFRSGDGVGAQDSPEGLLTSDEPAGVNDCDVVQDVSGSGSDHSATLSWVPPSGVDSIRVRRNGVLIATLPGTATEFTETGLGPGVQNFDVTAVNGNFPSAPASTAVMIRPNAPTDLVCSPFPEGVLLTWTAMDTYESIEISRGGVPVATLPGTATQYSDALALDGVYEYTIVGRTNAVDSTQITCLTSVGAAGVAGLACSADGGTATLSWVNGSDYSQIEIRRDGTLIFTVPGFTESFTDPQLGLSGNGEHTYTITPLIGVAPIGVATCVVDAIVTPSPVSGLSCVQADACGTSLLANWTNSEVYDTIEVFLDGAHHMTLVGTDTQYVVPVTGPGAHMVNVRGVRHDLPSPMRFCSVVTSPSQVASSPTQFTALAVPGTCEVSLSWTPQGIYAGYDLLADGELVATLPGTAGGGLFAMPSGGLHVLSMVAYGECGDPLPAVSTVVACHSWFLRGDATGEGQLDVSDVITVLGAVFGTGESIACRDAADTNDDGVIDITDAIHGLQVLFNGAPIAAPFDTCGGDSTPDTLGCASHAACP